MNAVFFTGLKHIKDSMTNYQFNTGMENNEEILSRLKFIGKIEKDEKINVRHVNRQPNNIMTKLQRSLIYPDNRANALKFIKDVIHRSFEIIDNCNIHNNTVISKGIISDLMKAQQGIINFKYTYGDDTKFCCDMDVIIENINIKLLALKENYPDLFQDSPKIN